MLMCITKPTCANASKPQIILKSKRAGTKDPSCADEVVRMMPESRMLHLQIDCTGLSMFLYGARIVIDISLISYSRIYRKYWFRHTFGRLGFIKFHYFTAEIKTVEQRYKM